jgi:hypothetical protein
VSTAARVAKNEAAFREVNERIKDVSHAFAGFGPSPVEFVCECSREGCFDLIALTLEEYAEVRAVPERFFVVPGHESPEFERVVERNDRYLVVEKFGEAGEVAAETNPASPARPEAGP